MLKFPHVNKKFYQIDLITTSGTASPEGAIYNSDGCQAVDCGGIGFYRGDGEKGE